MNHKAHFAIVLSLWVCALVCCISCFHKKEVAAPKPAGYFRIDLPGHSYQKMDTTLPFSFEKSIYSQVVINKQKDGTYWVDLNYPKFNATFKFTYFPLKTADSLRGLLVREDKMVKFHYQMADDVEYSIIKAPEAKLWGQIYDISGKEVATPLQFWMTDSAHNFLRATLYFNFTPNNDSLQPVIQYLRQDAMHLVNTFSWK